MIGPCRQYKCTVRDTTEAHFSLTSKDIWCKRWKIRQDLILGF
jgi:hypothetical protein